MIPSIKFAEAKHSHLVLRQDPLCPLVRTSYEPLHLHASHQVIRLQILCAQLPPLPTCPTISRINHDYLGEGWGSR